MQTGVQTGSFQSHRLIRVSSYRPAGHGLLFKAQQLKFLRMAWRSSESLAVELLGLEVVEESDPKARIGYGVSGSLSLALWQIS